MAGKNHPRSVPAGRSRSRSTLKAPRETDAREAAAGINGCETRPEDATQRRGW